MELKINMDMSDRKKKKKEKKKWISIIFLKVKYKNDSGEFNKNDISSLGENNGSN